MNQRISPYVLICNYRFVFSFAISTSAFMFQSCKTCLDVVSNRAAWSAYHLLTLSG